MALLVEALLGLILLSLSRGVSRPEERAITIVTLDAVSNPEPRRAQPEAKEKVALSEETPAPARPQPSSQPPTPPSVQSPAPLFLELSREQMATADIADPQADPDPEPAAAVRRPIYGPAHIASSGDTARVDGAGPNGEPLYAASWYREPYDNELRGYLSTARGPGWGLIACRTAPDFRVEDCVAIREFPDGSAIARAALAAAWQFRVRPPRIGGQAKIGEWVRIRIEYDRRL